MEDFQNLGELDDKVLDKMGGQFKSFANRFK